tara:strand:+ start:1891 stop:2301 length:411 start_codon:yes stop_codon:yes gene_type:complete
MIKDFTESYCANKNLHAFRYGYATSIEREAPMVKLACVLATAVTAAFIGLVSGGLLVGMAAAIVGAVAMHSCFVDFAALFVPNPEVKNPNLSLASRVAHNISPALSKRAARKLGKEAGSEYVKTECSDFRFAAPSL